MNAEQEKEISRAIFREANDAFVLVRPGDLRLTSVNPAFEKLTGGRQEQLIGVELGEVIEAESPEAMAELKRCCQTTTHLLPPQSNYLLACHDGERLPIQLTVSRIPLQPEPLALVVIRDISVYVRAQRWDRCRRHILEQIATGKRLSLILEAIVGFVEQEAIGASGSILLLDRTRTKLVHGAAPRLPDFYNQAVHGIQIGPTVGSSGAAAFTRQRVIVEDVETHPYWEPFRDLVRRAGLRSCWSDPIFSSTREVLGTFAIYHPNPRRPSPEELEAVDVSTHLASIAIERTEVEEVIRDSQQMLQMVLNNIPQGVFWKDRQSRYLGCNRVVAQAFGLGSPEAILGKDDHHLPGLTPEQAEFFVAKDRQVMEQNAAEFGIVEPATLANGATIWMETNKIPMCDAAGQVIGVLGTWQDITDRVYTEQALRDSQELFETFMRHSPAVAFIKTEDDRLLYVNKAYEEQIWEGNPPDWRNRTGEELWPAEMARQFRENDLRILRSGKAEILEETVVKPRGNETWLCCKFPIARHTEERLIGGMAINITERKVADEVRRKLEAQLQHAQKLESLGVLAGGIAHDFNNLLTGILGYSDLALLELPSASPARPLIEEAVKGARRAAELTTQMLAYSGKGRFVVEALDLSLLTEEMTRLLQISISKKCVLKFNLMADLPAIEADASQVRQVIMNLLINASEAIGEKSGVIVVSTGVMHCDRAYLGETYLDEKLPEGLYVFLEVNDTGCGMSEETRAKIFDPFFTTKFTGRGLGLSAVLGIVRGHRGAIKCYSELGRGTTFKVLFPATNLPVKHATRQEEVACHWRGSGTVLVVDDEESVRALARHMLEMMGFTVLTAEDGEQGVEVFRVHGERIRLVLLDMTMPRLDGEATFRELRRLRANVQAILTSGYDEQTATSRFAGKGLAAFIQKPYRFEELLGVVRQVFERQEREDG